MDNATAITGAISVPVIIALIQYLVKPWFANEKFYPMIAIGLALLFNILATGFSTNWVGTDIWNAITVGILTGVAASASYDKVIKPFKEETDQTG